MKHKIVGRLRARGRTHVQAVDEDGRPFHVDSKKKKSPRNDILTDEQIAEIWAEEKKRGRA